MDLPSSQASFQYEVSPRQHPEGHAEGVHFHFEPRGEGDLLNGEGEMFDRAATA
ncbi:hypothetical protein T492DRAFT_869255 [Pavlovales sp. CCMP2436]|nr:hypothetical protein T492DRAFT_869255 [Pavlovales sp. CCMP2436]